MDGVTMIGTWPGGMKEKLAAQYVGGSPTWEALLAAYPDRLIPFRRAPVRGDSIYRKVTIDGVMELAELEGKLRAEPTQRSKPPKAAKS